MLGGAIGDAMGSRYENQPAMARRASMESWQLTDDTQLTLATCEAIAGSGQVDPAGIADSFLRWYSSRRPNWSRGQHSPCAGGSGRSIPLGACGPKGRNVGGQWRSHANRACRVSLRSSRPCRPCCSARRLSNHPPQRRSLCWSVGGRARHPPGVVTGLRLRPVAVGSGCRRASGLSCP